MGQLDADWLSVEFASAEAEVESWSDGLKASLINHKNFLTQESSETHSNNTDDPAIFTDSQ